MIILSIYGVESPLFYAYSKGNTIEYPGGGGGGRWSFCHGQIIYFNPARWKFPILLHVYIKQFLK